MVQEKGVNKITVHSDCNGTTLSAKLYPSKEEEDILIHQISLGMVNVTIPKLNNTILDFAHIPSISDVIISPEHLGVVPVQCV